MVTEDHNESKLDGKIMERCAKVRFSAENEHGARYIHKYYLPQELRVRILPADIDGISLCFASDDECNVWEGLIPDKVSDCVILYKDLGLEKRIDGETVHRVLIAIAAYHADGRAELTPEEDQAAMNLNTWFMEWEKDLLARCIKLRTEMERQVRSGDSWLTDYEIDVEVAIGVRDDDSYSADNMPDGWRDDIDADPALLCTMKLLVIPKTDPGDDKYWGIGDNQDHNDCRGNRDEGIYNMRHCTTFHELFSHSQIPIKHAGRIGRVFTDIIVRHQNGINVDLTGKQAIAVLDEPRIREKIVLCDEATQKPVSS